MNATGELLLIIGLTALACTIIGWCLRSLFTRGAVKNVVSNNTDRGPTERSSSVRGDARDHKSESAAHDVRRLRQQLGDREQELRETKSALKQATSKDDQSESGNRAQVAEINQLKKELATTQKSLHANKSEFASYLTKSQNDKNDLQNELSKFKSGGSANSERITEANETISALRGAVRENDKVIESLRARVKETDSTVENLRTQFTSAETGRKEVQTVSLEYDRKLENLSKQLEQNKVTVEKQKRDYDLMLENKNSDIRNLHSKIEQSTTDSSSLKSREHDFKKQSTQYKETESKYKAEIVDLKNTLSQRDAALTKARNQIGDLNTQVSLAKQHEEKEVKRLRARVDSSADVESKFKSKSAEVSALNEMLKDSAGKRDSLQTNLDKANTALTEKETRINALQTDLDDVVASRNKVSTQLGELQSKGNIALEKLQQDFNNLAKTRDEYKTRIDNLQKEVSDLKNTNLQHESELKESTKQLNNKNQTLLSETKVLQHEVRTLDSKRTEYKSQIEGLQKQLSELTKSKESQLAALRNQLTSEAQNTEKKLQTENQQLTGKTKTLENDLKTLQAKLRDQYHSLEQREVELSKHTETNQRLSAQLGEKDREVSDFRNKLVREETESQRLNSELSDAEALRLKLTERDAELRKAQIELQDAASSGPMQSLVDEQTRKNDSLMAALQERDEEISRLNNQVTNSSLKSKQQQSSINLLTQEKDAQVGLIKSLEVQAENTLELHTKIAQQSTELEELRARLYERDSKITAAGKLQQVETRHTTTGTTASSKPRVFVRSDAEELAGTSNFQAAQRPQFTLDGHRVRRPDGSDDLSLLPGITPNLVGTLGRNGVSDFEQIALWTDREVTHYAERIGLSTQLALQYNWPQAAKNILNGSYRKDGQEIGN